jgi:hypothetical protein
MKTLNLIAAILFTSIVVFAGDEKLPLATTTTTTISGTVIDKITGEVLAGVKIYLNESTQEVYTDFDGNFIFKDVKQGTHSIETNLISYETSTVEIDCNTEINNIKIVLDNK